MSQHASLAPVSASPYDIKIRNIGKDDLWYALSKGLDDFKANPSHLVFLSIIYPVMGLILARFTEQASLLPLIFPLVAGFALIGPFAAIGLYNLSYRREQGLTAGWRDAFSAFQSPAIGSILVLGLMLMVIFVIWLATARLIYHYTIGSMMPETMGALIGEVLGTPQGWALIIVGNAVGFLFALVAFTISVISFPLLLDRNVGVGAAIQASINAVRVNPRSMSVWAAIVVGGLILGSIPFLVGLALVMPILGHATWHLYRRVVAPD